MYAKVRSSRALHNSAVPADQMKGVATLKVGRHVGLDVAAATGPQVMNWLLAAIDRLREQADKAGVLQCRAEASWPSRSSLAGNYQARDVPSNV